jgi:hypothetical protein
MLENIKQNTALEKEIDKYVDVVKIYSKKFQQQVFLSISDVVAHKTK